MACELYLNKAVKKNNKILDNKMAKIKNTDNTKHWRGCGETETLKQHW